ncbi:MAG: tRNA (N6-isopentenyl adenosine(37)-C2)-methylthiotransferase MiaB [candidate division NC10 bacterium]|nr:tRNA (N6-isopentenyl adenosine(37)-C2)-methylthiotransferase MiaB [candidate division NC10 bacterium]
MPKLKVVTFGCQANELDSARIAGILARDGYTLTEDETEADLVILNGCSIREKAEQKLFSRLGTLQALKAEHPRLRLGVAGCLAQREGEALLRRFPYLDFVVGNGEHLAEIPQLLSIAPGQPAVAASEPVGLFPEDADIHRDSRIRAWVGIMEGCDNFCTFCVVPFTRGRERSRHPDDILREVIRLRGAGYREITLLGQTVNSYGKKLDPPVPFAELLRRIDAAVGAAMRLRFTTSYPPDVTPGLAEAMAALPSVCEHIHLPVQAGSTRTLLRMRRTYTREAYLEKVAVLRAAVPDLAITTDIIVGFPGETDGDFAETLTFMEEVGFDGCFAFKFSPRSGTPAADLPDQVPESIKSARLTRVLELQRHLSLQRNQAAVGQVAEVLVDRELCKRDSGLAAGRTRRNKIVHFEGGEVEEGQLVNVEITEATSHHLKGVLIASL